MSGGDQTAMVTKSLARQQLPYWKQLLDLRPDSCEVMQNVASCMFGSGEVLEAHELYRVVDTWDHKNPAMAMNYGMVLKDMGLFSQSAEIVQHAWLGDLDNWYLRLGYAESLLRNGNWRDAWPLYDEARPSTKEGSRNMYGVPNSVKLWTGQPLKPPNNRLCVLGEGGTGDRITYSRWLPELDKLGIDWCYFADPIPPIPGLHSLLERVPWLTNKIRKPGDKFNASHWTTVFSLPAAFDAVPTQIPEYPTWFRADRELKQKYAMKGTDNKPIVGLIWGANELFEGGMKFRSLLESQAMRLVMSTADMVNWVNCWQGDSHGTPSVLGHPVFNPKFENWEETAALLANMDAVVTTDNGAGWLAQALGKPTGLLLSGNSDWKFLRGIAKSYWHKRTRIFRNEGRGFENAIDKLIAAIRNGEGIGHCVPSKA